MRALFRERQHPRGPNGRFTESHTAPLDAKAKRRAESFWSRFQPRKVATADEARIYLSGLPGTKGPPDPAIGAYLSDPRAINDALRAGNADGPDIAALDRAMLPLPDDLAVFRRVPASAFGDVDPKSLIGMGVRDAGFFPATLAPAAGDPTDVLLRVSLPAGTKAAPAPDAATVVVDRAVDMAVVEVTDRPDGGVDLHLVAIPEGVEPSGDTAPTTAQPPDQPAPQPAAAPPADQPSDFDRRAASATTGPDALAAVRHSIVRDTGLWDDEREALVGYRSTDYTPINRRLRDNITTVADRVDRRLARAVEDMDEAMRQSPLPADTVVYRGLDARSLFGERVGGDLTGLVWREDAYSSTTADETVAAGFAAGGGTPVVMRILTPAGVGAVEMSDASYESELLLQRGLTLRVVADRGVGPGGVRMLNVEVVPGG